MLSLTKCNNDTHKECSCCLKKYLPDIGCCSDYCCNECSHILLSKGEKLIKQSDLNNNIYYIQEGNLKVQIYTPSRKEQILRILNKGGFIGLHSLHSKTPSVYSVSAITSSIVCCIDRNIILKIMRNNFEFSLDIIKSFTESNLFTLNKLFSTYNKQTNGRTADAILYLSETLYKSDTFELNISKSDLGKLVGISRESFSRSFSQLIRDKIIEVKKDYCRILDKNKLRFISEHG